MIRSDQHLHTSFSADSEASLPSMLDAALEKGLSYVCVTDHDDFGFCAPGIGPMEDLPLYVRSLLEARETYRGRLDVGLGIELGLQPQLGDHFREMTASHPFDLVIGSLHIFQGKDPYLGELFDTLPEEGVYRLAFQETQRCIRAIPDFDVLGHLDYIVRYGKRKAKAFHPEMYWDVLDPLFRALAENGKGLEINTSGRAYLGYFHPHETLLRRFRSLGGEIITLGSDAHAPGRVGEALEEAGTLLQACGYKYYTEFHGRKPQFIKL